MKKNKPSNIARIQHILEAIENIQKFIEGMDFEDFEQNLMAISACERQIGIIGEAANHIDEDIQKQTPEVDWKVMIGMRNFLIHVYFGVDSEKLWMTLQNDLVPLKRSLEPMLKILQAEQDNQG